MEDKLKQFSSKPVAFIALMLMGAVAYLFMDNRALHEKYEQYLVSQSATIVEVLQENTRALCENTSALRRLDENVVRQKKTK